jgi:hypothetical protein
MRNLYPSREYWALDPGKCFETGGVMRATRHGNAERLSLCVTSGMSGVTFTASRADLWLSKPEVQALITMLRESVEDWE